MSPCPLLCSLASVPVSCLCFLGPGPVNLHPLSVSLPPVVVSLPPPLFPCLLSPFLCLMFLLPPNPVSYLLSLFSRARPCLLASFPCFLVSCPCFLTYCCCLLAPPLFHCLLSLLPASRLCFRGLGLAFFTCFLASCPCVLAFCL
jgi:hypothetical protein